MDREKLSSGARPLGGKMKRTAATLALLAGFGGGCMNTGNSSSPGTKDPVGGYGTVTRGQQVPGVVGPNGEPIMAARGATPSGVTQAGGTVDSGGIQQVSLFRSSSSSGDCQTCAHIPGTTGAPMWNPGFASKFYTLANGNPLPGGGPPSGPAPGMNPGGIFPVPGQGPPGAVAAVGALGIGGQGAVPGGMSIGRTSVRFTGPAGMKITWQLPNGGFNDEASGLTAPKEYNFLQSQTYRLRLTQVLPNFPGKSFYPTLEVAAGNPKSLTFLAHSSVPLTFTNDDFEQAKSGNLVVKVIYLPDRENQDFAAVAGAEELVSTRLEPGADPVAEAQRKGTILAVIRLGNIDLENRASPSMIAPPPAMSQSRPAPIMLPGPTQTMPGISAPAMPPKPMSSSPSTSATTSTVPTLPSVPTSGSPNALPPIAPSPSTGFSIPTTLPPVK